MKNRLRGFTLIEALFAMVVIVIGLVGIFFLFQTALSNMTIAKTRMQCALLASNFLEEVKSFGYSNLPASSSVSALSTANPSRITNFPSPFTGAYTLASASEDLDGDGSNDYADKSNNSTLKDLSIQITMTGTTLKPMTFRTRMAQS